MKEVDNVKKYEFDRNRIVKKGRGGRTSWRMCSRKRSCSVDDKFSEEMKHSLYA